MKLTPCTLGGRSKLLVFLPENEAEMVIVPLIQTPNVHDRETELTKQGVLIIFCQMSCLAVDHLDFRMAPQTLSIKKPSELRLNGTLSSAPRF